MRKKTEQMEMGETKAFTSKTLLLQAAMTILAILFIAPIFIVINYSFKTKRELYVNSPLSLPSSLNFENYINAFDKLNMATTFVNTAFYTLCSVLILAAMCGISAWAIARCKSRLFNFFYIYYIIGILIPAQALFLPIYTIGYKMNLVNTRFGIIFIYVATGMSFGVFLMTSFMSNVPTELEESARIDGCSIFKTYFLIVMPLLKPAMATLVIMQAFQIWNDYLMASLYVSKKQLKTLIVAMQSLFSAQSSDYTTAMAAIIVSVLPIAILFICMQKYFIKGITVGAVKG